MANYDKKLKLMKRAVLLEIIKSRRSISIYGPQPFGGTKLIQVNWSALGSQSYQETRRFAKLLLEASEIASELNKLNLNKDEWDELRRQVFINLEREGILK
jgi:hypothetical protein